VNIDNVEKNPSISPIIICSLSGAFALFSQHKQVVSVRRLACHPACVSCFTRGLGSLFHPNYCINRFLQVSRLLGLYPPSDTADWCIKFIFFQPEKRPIRAVIMLK
jgi:hypothetical protein